MATSHASFRIPASLAKRLRALAKHNRGAPHFLTLDGFVANALDAAVSKFEQKHNKGKAYAAPRSR
jgi:hypothetical protein